MVSTAHELYLKTLQGDLNWVKSLLTPQAMAKSGVDVVAPSPESTSGESPLFAAARLGYTQLVSLLLDAHTRTHRPEQKKRRRSSQDDDEDVPAVDVPLGGQQRLRTVLHVAALHGHVAVVRELLSRGASVARVDRDGASPLHLAAGQGHAGVVAQLLRAQADVATRDAAGKTALDVAREAGHADVVTLLERYVLSRPVQHAFRRSASMPVALRSPSALLPEDLRSWSAQHVTQWLRTVLPPDVVRKLSTHMIDGEVLCDLDDLSLDEIGVLTLHRRKLLRHRDRLLGRTVAPMPVVSKTNGHEGTDSHSEEAEDHKDEESGKSSASSVLFSPAATGAAATAATVVNKSSKAVIKAGGLPATVKKALRVLQRVWLVIKHWAHRAWPHIRRGAVAVGRVLRLVAIRLRAWLVRLIAVFRAP